MIRLEVMGHLSFWPLAPTMGSWHCNGALKSRFLMGSVGGAACWVFSLVIIHQAVRLSGRQGYL